MGRELKAYAHAAKIGLVDIDFFEAMHILNGLNPVPCQRDVHKKSFGIKGVRAGDLLPPMRWRELKALLHVSDPMQATEPRALSRIEQPAQSPEPYRALSRQSCCVLSTDCLALC